MGKVNPNVELLPAQLLNETPLLPKRGDIFGVIDNKVVEPRRAAQQLLGAGQPAISG